MYVQWWNTGKCSVNGRCFDIDITTRSALANFVATKNVRASGERSERASGTFEEPRKECLAKPPVPRHT
jgi:ADP-ribosyl-[dinitrogen reductase] hydrolase